MPGETTDRGDDFVPTGPDATSPPAVVVTAEDLTKVPKVVADAPADEPDVDPDNPDADPKPAKKDTRIPLARHTEIINKLREERDAALKQVDNSRQSQAVATTNEQLTVAENSLLGLEKEYTKLVADGAVDKAAEKMGEIRRTERSINTARSTFEVQAAEARAYERVKYDTTVERLEAAYPTLNPDHDDFDEAKSAEVVELMGGYVATGKYSRAEAIQKAVKVLMPAATTRQEAATETDARVDKGDVAKAAAAERAAAQRKKNGDVAGKQPASMAKVGTDSDKLGGVVTAEAAMKMNQEQFAKLSEADLIRMRGDELV